MDCRINRPTLCIVDPASPVPPSRAGGRRARLCERLGQELSLSPFLEFGVGVRFEFAERKGYLHDVVGA